ncbi:MAG: hypothetical protein M0C28_47910 [Candidatus Moduliflexus flocculans]|nr:hypothetical protein [Candidatus Moduliflexus flocculans]
MLTLAFVLVLAGRGRRPVPLLWPRPPPRRLNASGPGFRICLIPAFPRIPTIPQPSSIDGNDRSPRGC